MNTPKVGEFFEDCGFRPAVCLTIEKDDRGNDDIIRGICILNGNLVACSVNGCGPRKLSRKETVNLVLTGPDPERLKKLECSSLDTWKKEERWWETKNIKWLNEIISNSEND